MAISDEYLEYLKEQLAWLPQLYARRMFGGAGFYSDELFFAIATNNGLYLKGDADSRGAYKDGGGERFTYEAKGRVSQMNFWSVPADVLENEDELHRWVAIALEAALRVGK